MNRLWSRVGIRVCSVGLLVLGVIGGVYLGQGREVQQQGAEAQLVVQADADELQLLKERQSDHAAARAWRNEAEGDAAAKAAVEAKAAASKARKLEKKVIEKKAAEKKAAEKKAAEVKKAESPGGNAASVPFTGPIPASCNEFTGNREVGCALMIKSGFGIDQFPCLNKLWNKESNWRTTAANNSSGAYGIPQSLPGSKMASAGSDWKTNPATQIKWGLGYIEGRYGSPCKAWSHSQSVGWY